MVRMIVLALLLVVAVAGAGHSQSFQQHVQFGFSDQGIRLGYGVESSQIKPVSFIGYERSHACASVHYDIDLGTTVHLHDVHLRFETGRELVLGGLSTQWILYGGKSDQWSGFASIEPAVQIGLRGEVRQASGSYLYGICGDFLAALEEGDIHFWLAPFLERRMQGRALRLSGGFGSEVPFARVSYQMTNEPGLRSVFAGVNVDGMVEYGLEYAISKQHRLLLTVQVQSDKVQGVAILQF